ncbi:MAG: T9SS type A sorting domain-containing protein [Ignavibacteriae bacterium]|nr:T9SS type A sorting domain-containing protein [Ignavibacteriota bacterium]
MTLRLIIIFVLLVSTTSINGQKDTTKYPWPVVPLNSSQSINGTFGEFRNTLSSDHFHNAVDIGEPDGNPVYPSISGTVYNKVNNGYDSYINVKSIVNGKKKHMTYYHVVPSPSLSIGQQITAGQTTIGTIYVGAAHVHLIERELTDLSSGSLGTAINPIRPDGGLTPYTDTKSPTINKSSLKFYKDNSTSVIASNQLSGKVDIQIQVKEQNGSASVSTNNGTFLLGYRVLSADSSTIIYEPNDNGDKYKFYRLPSNSYVHRVFVKGVATLSNPTYWLTNGSGESTINSTLAVSNNYLNTDNLLAGNYLLQIYSEDTRGNTTSELFPISVIKLPPELNFVKENGSSNISVSWNKYNLSNLKGYRLYLSINSMENWHVIADENLLGRDSTYFNFDEYNSMYFYITAVDSLGNESPPSDIYSSYFNYENLHKVLIVDGFDRYTDNGSWTQPQHSFNTTYFNAITNNRSLSISSCSNETIIDGGINLQDYDLVVWFTGDETTVDNTLINKEQFELAKYLEGGGKLFITGDDIGHDLDTQHSNNEFSDTLFYHQYLKSNLKHDGNTLLFEVNGQEGSYFENYHAIFGEVYPEDSPDDIEPINGAEPILNYTYERDSTFRKGGIAYTGTFGDSANIGQLVYLSFAFETIGDESLRNELMKRILQYFDIVTDVDNKNLISPKIFSLSQNYPNPFNPTTIIKYTIPVVDAKFASTTNVRLSVYDLLGREIITLVNEKKTAGNYEAKFDASLLSSGIYFYQLKYGEFVSKKKMMLLK